MPLFPLSAHDWAALAWALAEERGVAPDLVDSGAPRLGGRPRAACLCWYAGGQAADRGAALLRGVDGAVLLRRSYFASIDEVGVEARAVPPGRPSLETALALVREHVGARPSDRRVTFFL